MFSIFGVLVLVLLAAIIFLMAKVRRLEAALYASESRATSANRTEVGWSAMMNATSQSLLVLDESGEIVWANDAAMRLFGFEKTPTPYPTLRECLSEHIAHELEGAIRTFPESERGARGKCQDVLEASYTTANSVPISLTMEYTPVAHDSGRFLIFAEDISSLVRQEADPVRSQNFYERMLENASLAMAYCDDTDQIQVMNRSFAEIFTQSKANMLGRGLSRFLSAADMGALHEKLSSLKVGGRGLLTGLTSFPESACIYMELVKPAESPGYYLFLPSAVDQHFNTSDAENTVHSETDAYPSFSIMNKRYERLRIALDNIKVGVWEYQIPENRIIWDDQMYRIYDLDRADFDADYDAWVAALLPEDFEAATRLVSHCITRNEPFNTIFRVSHRDGSMHVISAEAVILCDERGRANRMIGTNVDITEKYSLEQSLHRALEEARGLAMQRAAFMGTMSHELRTPLNGVLGMLDMLLHSKLNPDQVKQVRIAQRSADSLLAILHDVLEINTLNMNEVRLEERPFDLWRLLGDFVQSVSMAVEAKGLTLVLDAADVTHSAVLGDADRLRQLLTNLVGNAKKFTQRGEIILRCASQLIDGCVAVKISVIDTGVGIEPEVMSQLFDPFYQVDSSPTRECGGVGLGLSICKRLCEVMGGSISVESTPGQGAVFRFEFSVKPDMHNTLGEQQGIDQDVGAQALPLPQLLARFSGRRMLVALSNGAERLALRRQLEQWGVVVTEARTGREAQQVVASVDTWHSQAARKLYDAILVDRYLEDVTGPELVALLRQQGVPSAVPCILCSTFSDFVDDRILAEWEIAGYLCKPIAPILLEQALDRVMGHKTAIASPNATIATVENCEGTLVAKPATQGAAPSREVSGAAGVVVTQPAIEDQSLEYWVMSLQRRKDLQVLVVEDNEVNQEIVLLFLQEIGLSATVASNGQEAIACLLAASRDEKPMDVIFMDCQMPVMDGYDATRAIRSGQAGEQNKHIPIIALTANALSGDREKCLAAGMDDYLSKPVTVEDFYARLAHWSGMCCDLKVPRNWAAEEGNALAPTNARRSMAAESPLLEKLGQIQSKHLTIWDQAAAIKAVGSEDILCQLVRVFCERKSERLQKILFNFTHYHYEALAVSMQALKRSADQLMGCELSAFSDLVKHAAAASDKAICDKLRPEFTRSFERLGQVFERYLADKESLERGSRKLS